MFQSRIFTVWFLTALVVWAGLFGVLSDVAFLAAHWFYPAIMVVGAFVAGLTPEGGGAVAFPVLSVFLHVDRVLARDFSLMIQSVGMTSASIYILTHRGNALGAYRPVLFFVPVAFVGFLVGMWTLQGLPVFLMQAAFLSLITTFAIAYVFGKHRGIRRHLDVSGLREVIVLGLILFAGGLCASLFGTGTDILLYSLLVTRFRLDEKVATHMSILLMAAVSVLGFVYRGWVDASLTNEQVQVWLCAYPVVLFMAPFGAFILHRVSVEWMLRGIVVLNVGQLLYFNFHESSWEKSLASVVFCAVLMIVFARTLWRAGGSGKSS